MWLAGRDHFGASAIALLEVAPPLSAERVRAALEAAIQANEVLRTVFRRVPGVKVPLQVVLPEGGIKWETLAVATPNAGELDRLFEAERRRRFDLEAGPTLHVTWLSLADGRAALLLTVPGLVSDAASLRLLTNLLNRELQGETPAADSEAISYVQFAQWQRDLAESEDEEALLGRAFWQSATADPPAAPALPGASPGTALFSLQSVAIALGDETARQLGRGGAEIEAVLLAAWQAFVARLTGAKTFSIDVFASGRHYEELAETLGYLGRTVPVRWDAAANATFEPASHAAGRALEDARRYQEYFDSKTIDANAIAFAYSEEAETAGDLAIRRLEAPAEPFALKLWARRTGAKFILELQYDASQIEPESAAEWAGYFQTFLSAALKEPQRSVAQLPLLNAQQMREITLEWNRTESSYPREVCFQELFEAQAARTPTRVAVQSGDRAITYGELNAQANQIAHALRQRGVGPDAPVGLCVTRGVGMITAALGILKAGGAYLPLIGDHPKARLAQQMETAVALVTEQEFMPQLPALSGATLCLDRDAAELAAASRENPGLETTADSLVYVIYTSGSTGTPKGVAVRHRNLVNYIFAIRDLLDLAANPDGLRFATVSTLSADLGNTCIYPALAFGGLLHVIPQDVATDSARFREYLREYPVDVCKIVPSHLEALLDAGGGREILPRRYLITGGEALTGRVVAKLRALDAPCRLLNHYGPTETTVGSLTHWVSDPSANDAVVPIGKPIANTAVYILDSHQQPVPRGVRGELYISGDGVAAGYLGQPALTQERFLPDPFHEGARMYRTGDLVRYLPDRSIEFLGRADDQVKIRGFRVELGEIEAELERCPGVRRAVVVARQQGNGERALAAYVVSHEGKPLDAEALSARLRERLPEYMIPAALVFLPKLPLNANGKVDRQALPSPEQAAAQRKVYVAPANPAEEQIAGVWSEILGRARVSVEDNFFELGGHSLLATRIASRLREVLGRRVAVRTIFERPTVRQLASAVALLPGEDDDFAFDAEITPAARKSGRS